MLHCLQNIFRNKCELTFIIQGRKYLWSDNLLTKRFFETRNMEYIMDFTPFQKFQLICYFPNLSNYLVWAIVSWFYLFFPFFLRDIFLYGCNLKYTKSLTYKVLSSLCLSSYCFCWFWATYKLSFKRFKISCLSSTQYLDFGALISPNIISEKVIAS